MNATSSSMILHALSCSRAWRVFRQTAVVSACAGLCAAAAAPAWAQQAAAGAAPAASAAASPNEVAEIQRLLKDGQHAQALKMVDDALTRNPKDAQMRFRRGVALSMLDRKPEALTVFQKLIEDHPEMPAPYNNMAVIYGAQGEYDKARNALERAIRTNPAYATAYQNLGDVYAQLASQAYTKALQLDKTDTAAVQPKLALLRELVAGPNTAPPAASVAKREPVVAVAAAKTPPAAAAAVTTPPAAAAPPAVAAVAPVKPAAVTTPAQPPAAAANTAVAEVEQAVRAWAGAWSRRNMDDYIGAYAPDFTGQAASRAAWQKDRRDRIVGKKQIKVEVSDLKVTVNGDQATARFRQSYSSDALSTSGRKTLELARANGKWLIRRESAGG